MHHLCYRVADLQAELDRCRQDGVRVVYEMPRPGAGGHQVAFLHPESTGRVLEELLQDGHAG
jgi:methylmalonyl-CoA/ethylmalonyl-CoA epimerase